MAGKKKRHHGIIAPYVDDEYEQREDDYAEFQEWKRNRDQMQYEEIEDDYEPEVRAPRRRQQPRPQTRNRRRDDVRPVRRRKSHPFRLFFGLLFLLLLLFIVGTVVSMVGFGRGSQVRNYLLIGQDRREGEEAQRSDSMILVSVNKRTKKITLVSVMRDLYVEIPEHGKSRINAAYEYGGMKLLDRTIEQALNVQIDGNAEVDFDHFITAMGAVGNLDIELKDYEAEYLNVNSSYGGVENYAWHLTAGVNSLTPEQALAYSRIRYVGNSDWERTQRQRTVITTAFQKLKSQGPLKMVQVVTQIIPQLTTDMSPNEITALAMVIGMGGYDIGETYRVPFDGTYSNTTLDSGAQVLTADLDANAQKLREILE